MKKKNDNYHLGQLNRPVSQIDIQRNMVGFVVDGHIYLGRQEAGNHYNGLMHACGKVRLTWCLNCQFAARCVLVLLPRAHAQGVKQSVCPSVVVVVVVVVGTKIARSRVLGICACCKHNQSVDVREKLACSYALRIAQKGLATGATNRAFSV